MPMQTYVLELFGLGRLADAMQPLIDAANNPEAQAQVMGLIQGLIQTTQTVQRIEMKLDVLLADRGLGSAHYPPEVLAPPQPNGGTSE